MDRAAKVADRTPKVLDKAPKLKDRIHKVQDLNQNTYIPIKVLLRLLKINPESDDCHT